MNLAKTNENEINELSRFLNELVYLAKDLESKDLRDIEFSNPENRYQLLRGTKAHVDDDDYFNNTLLNILSKLRDIHFTRILLNCSTMLSNCAYPDNKVLGFNSDIKEGLKLLEEKRNPK